MKTKLADFDVETVRNGAKVVPSLHGTYMVIC